MQALDSLAAGAWRQVRGVFTDIDDTLTTEGAITADALQALADLDAAGLTVIAITGRPVGWSAPFALAWPLRAMRRNDAREVSSQVRNIRTRLSLRTKATIEKVNPDMMR